MLKFAFVIGLYANEFNHFIIHFVGVAVKLPPLF